VSDDVYEVFAIRYAHHDRPASANFLRGDPHDNSSNPLDFFVWAISGADGIILVDTGYDETMAARRDRKIVKPIAEGLKAIGIAPDKVKNIVVSHLHWDHAGNYDLFPNARYHLQDCEMAYATGRCMCHPELLVPFEADDVVAMVRKVFAGRVEFHDGDDALAPGITLHKIGGHSRGLQAVSVNTRRGPVVLASDASHLYAHFEQGKVFPLVYDVGQVLEGYKILKRLAPTLDHIIPGHDPLVCAKYPAAANGLENWVVRLDVDPKPTG
jgi:glyoxylase-like metal-dependent hydrolase (beta-lactamase superfamily II)